MARNLKGEGKRWIVAPLFNADDGLARDSQFGGEALLREPALFAYLFEAVIHGLARRLLVGEIANAKGASNEGAQNDGEQGTGDAEFPDGRDDA